MNKHINLENVFKCDRPWEFIVSVKTRDTIKIGTWIETVNAIQMPQGIHKDIYNLFENSKAMCIYGWCYYPLIFCAMSNIFMLSELVVKKISASHGITVKKNSNYQSLLVGLHEKGIFDNNEYGIFDKLRSLRNSVAHQEFQMLVPPGYALDAMKKMAEICCKRILELQ